MMRVGYTAGVFDLFHIGHLNLLENAKALCDYLIVGVNSDELTASYKDIVPVVPFVERVRIVAAIRVVDETIRVDTRDREEIWRMKPFNLLFVGDDWKGSAYWVEVERVLGKHGVQTVYLPYTIGTTSTLIRERLLEGSS
jgi:cytidyltransferase-like protein